MTKQEKIEFIKQKCVEANPSIMDLVFGCWVLYGGQPDMPYRITQVQKDSIGIDPHVDIVSEDGQSDELVTIDILEILGRDIRLADIVYALEMNSRYVELYYNLLKDNLNDQSDECVEFIYNLLK